ncbi:MAG: 2-C-methyl-D-erythritol 2,4-cyclodiphosphate synthase [Candidatus Binatia bacterium]
MGRVGQGWDIHRLVAGRPLRLGGLEIPHERGLLGHSDGDAVLHAVTDALLGALAAGDIGQHFPDTDPRYRGADSAVLLAAVVQMVAARRQRVGNVDVTVLAERPKLAPFVPAMRARLAALLGVDEACVSIKAKTMEGLGAIGAGEAIGALAVVLLEAARRGGLTPAAPARRSGR